MLVAFDSICERNALLKLRGSDLTDDIVTFHVGRLHTCKLPSLILKATHIPDILNFYSTKLQVQIRAEIRANTDNHEWLTVNWSNYTEENSSEKEAHLSLCYSN